MLVWALVVAPINRLDNKRAAVFTNTSMEKKKARNKCLRAFGGLISVGLEDD